MKHRVWLCSSAVLELVPSTQAPPGRPLSPLLASAPPRPLLLRPAHPGFNSSLLSSTGQPPPPPPPPLTHTLMVNFSSFSMNPTEQNSDFC